MATFTSNYAWTKPAGSDPVDIGVLNNNLDSQDGIMHDAFLNMADPFSESSTYAVGNIVVYGTKTYKCHTAVTTAGSWTGSTNWDEYKLAEGGLVAGDYINIQNGVVNVQTEIGTYDYVRYELESTGGGAIKLIVRKYVNNVLDSTTEYPNDGQHHEIDDVMDTWYEYGPYLWHYKLLVASTDHAVGYEESWSYQDTSVHTVNFQFAQDDSTTLVTKGDLDDALANKVDKVTGKGLSTNDYTNTDKAEVAKVANKADKTATATGEMLSLVPTSEGRALIHTAYGMSTQSGTPTPSAPVDIESAKADFRCVGKNLIPYPYRETTNTMNGITFTDNGDGTVTASGTATATASFILCDNLVLDDGDYILTGDMDSETAYGNSAILFNENNIISGTAHWNYGINAPCNFTVDNYTINSLRIRIPAGATVSDLTFKPMLRLADVTDSTYEPYTKHDTTTDLTLRAIEVTSSDAYNLVRDGKYYIADTLDYSEDNGFGVTRRIGHIASYDSETLTTKWMSSKDVYASGTYPSAGAVVDYILTSETTENITTAQALALLGLKTYDESTTISSQAEPSCTIAVEYAKERLGALALTAYNTAKGNDLRITALEG